MPRYDGVPETGTGNETQLTSSVTPEVDSAVAAIQAGLEKVSFVDGRIPHAVPLEAFIAEGVGTEGVPRAHMLPRRSADILLRLCVLMWALVFLNAQGRTRMSALQSH